MKTDPKLFDNIINEIVNDLDCNTEDSKDDIISSISKKELKLMSLLDKMEQLIELTKNCTLSNEFFKENKLLIQSVADDLQISPVQAVMLCPYVCNPGAPTDYNDLQHFFDCSSIAIMKRRNDLKALLRRRYICGCGGYRRRDGNFRLTERAQKAFCENHGLPIIKNTDLTPAEFMKAVRNLFYEVDRLQQLDSDDLLEEVMDLMADNQQLAIVKAFGALKVCDDEKVVMLYFCKQLLTEGEEGVPLCQIEDYLEDYDIFYNNMIKGSHRFITDDLLTPLGRDNLFTRDVYGLTDKARKLFLSEYELPKRDLKEQNIANANLISSKAIKPKSMFYSAEDQRQIDTLQGLLCDKQLKAIRKRLGAANMRKGFNCLFYGLPGTGKTETALQLARMTGRDIMQVDISSMRDKWYGETEKIVKAIFDDYAKLVKQEKRIPILLINEADALLSVRTGIGGSNPSIDKTENAIQNILLEAMENIDGIMIATTNLTCNLDPAFDRRFLYKVEFHQPSIEAKMQIWKSFLPQLSQTDATELARGFDFSGGQIENIARKVMVDHLLFGENPNLARMMELCANEKLKGRSNVRTPIGFR